MTRAEKSGTRACVKAGCVLSGPVASSLFSEFPGGGIAGPRLNHMLWAIGPGFRIAAAARSVTTRATIFAPLQTVAQHIHRGTAPRTGGRGKSCRVGESVSIRPLRGHSVKPNTLSHLISFGSDL